MDHLIKVAIFTLTGLEPTEDSSPEKYHLRLGKINPIIVGYSEAKRKLYMLGDLKYSALVEMLKAICEMMGNEKEFKIWLNNEGGSY